MPKIAAIQLCSSHIVKDNLKMAESLIQRATKEQAKLIVLPENFAIMGMDPADKLIVKEKIGNGPIQSFLSDQARKHACWIVGGTIPIASENESKVRATCLLFNDKGELAARYDKMNLFDVKISSTESYQESATIEAGNKGVVVDTPFGKLGFAVCYDVRFSELFRYLFKNGAEIIALPAAFTVKTGEAHWELLSRARAVENFSYVIGAAQGGTHTNGRSTYGHSLIVDPWGTVLSKINGTDDGVIIADVDLEKLHQIRRDMGMCFPSP